jgi:hypothetical protein
MLMEPKLRYAVYGQACFYLGLLICVLIRPAGLNANGGISYYGVYRDTIAPYLLAIFGPAFFSLKLAERLQYEDLKLLKYGLYFFCLLSIGIAATPDSIGRLMNYAHDGIGSVLFASQLLISCWMVWKLNFDRAAVIFTGLEFISGLIAFIYLAPPKGYLLQSEAAFQACFGALLIYFLYSEARIRNPGP